MYLALVFLITAAAARPLTVQYDRRQDGELNISADLQNIVILLAIPEKKASTALDLFDILKNKEQTRNTGLQERADHVMDAFVEPDTPYQVEIGNERSPNGGAVEIVIAGRRRLETEPQDDDDEFKLIGATEQCGPDRERDPVTLMCRFKKLDVLPEKPAPASPNSIKPVKDDTIKEPAKDKFIQKDEKKEIIPEKSKIEKNDDKPPVTPEVIST